MKFNKWTVGLLSVGAVSLASVAQADEKPSALMTAVSSTTISGYVDTSAQWQPGTGNVVVPGYAYNNQGKADGFNLDSIKVTIQKPLDESQWAAGYQVDLFFGPDANQLGTTSTGISTADFVIKQAYVALRTPIGNGIDWKIGVWDTIIGYESTEDPNNPNYTRWYGYTLEPTTHTGIQGTYKFSDCLSITAGIANTMGPTIGGFGPNASNNGNGGRANPPKAESYKTYMGSVALTAPNDWGFLAGSSLYGGIINGFNVNGGSDAAFSGGATQTSFYAGTTLNTPCKNIKAGLSYDYVSITHQDYNNIDVPESWANDVAAYTSFQVTEKLSLHGRAEYLWQSKNNPVLGANFVNGTDVASKTVELTATVQYDLWKNVLSRLEFRWDHAADGTTPFGGRDFNDEFGSKANSYMLAANIIYKF